jgi:hypothetical protein
VTHLVCLAKVAFVIILTVRQNLRLSRGDLQKYRLFKKSLYFKILTIINHQIRFPEGVWRGLMMPTDPFTVRNHGKVASFTMHGTLIKHNSTSGL